MAHDVFISYSHHDKAAADAVCAKLEQHQIRCWIAPRDVIPGIEWADCIINAIHTTRVMVLVFSSNANESPQIRKEVERAVNKGVVIVPLRIEDVVPTRSLEYFMSNVHWLDALTPPLEQHFEHLAGTVKMLIERADSGDINEGYSGIRPNAPSGAQRRKPRWLGIVPLAHRRFYVTAFAMIALAISGIFVWRYLHPSLKIPRLAVVGPTNDSANSKLDYLKTLVADIVSADLSQGTILNAVPREEIVQMESDISTPPNICSSKLHPVLWQQTFAASYAIFGSYRENADSHGNNIHIVLCLLDSDGNILGAPFEQDRDEATVGIFSALAADHFRSLINTKINTSLAAQDFGKDVFPLDPDASRLYFQGLADMRVFNAAQARDDVQEALHKEDSSPVIHSALSQAWSMLREDEKAKEQANAAVSRLPKGFPQDFDMSIRAGADEANENWDAAIELYKSLYNSHPERLDFGLKLAGAQRKGTKTQDAMTTLKGLAKLPKPLGNDPRILIEKSRLLMDTSDYRGSIQAAEAAETVAKQQKLQEVEATADLQLCYAYEQAGDVNAAQSSCIEAQQMFIAARNDVTAGVALNDIATWLTDRGRYEEAITDYDKVISIHDKAHDQLDLSGALINRGRVFAYQSRPAQAAADLQRAIGIARQIDDKEDEATALINLAWVSQYQGNTSEAAKQANEAREIAHAIPNANLEDSSISSLAQAKSETGEIAEALREFNALLKLRQKSTPGKATTLQFLGGIYIRLANFPEARRSFQEAQYLFAGNQQPDDATQALLNLAEVDLDNGNFSSAEAKVRQVWIAVSDRKDDADSKADALASLLRALVGQGPTKLPEAVELMKDLDKLKFTDFDVICDVALARGTVLIAEGRAADALGLLEMVASEASSRGKQFASLQLKLVAVQALEKTGDHASARNMLNQIKESAARLGFKLISNQANDLAHSLGI
jgi:tetratricopeptide (TPR) repeat protein